MTENAQPDANERAEKKKAAQFKYTPINPSSAYDRKTFVKAQGTLNDLREYRDTLAKDPYDVGARESLYEITFGDLTMHRGESPETVRLLADFALTRGSEGMEGYAANNWGKFMSVLDGKSMQKLALSLPLYKAEGKKEHNDLVSLIGDVKNMEHAASENEIGTMRDEVLGMIDSKYVPDWAKDLVRYFANDSNFVRKVYINNLSAKRSVLAEEISVDKKPNKKKLQKLIEDSLDSAIDAFEDEKSKSKKSDAWKANIRPYYLAIAAEARSAEKKVLEKDDTAKQDEKDREKFRFSMGMAA